MKENKNAESLEIQIFVSYSCISEEYVCYLITEYKFYVLFYQN